MADEKVIFTQDRANGEKLVVTLHLQPSGTKVDVRHWYKKEGVEGYFPGRQGIRMTLEEWDAVSAVKVAKEDRIARKSSAGTSGPQGKAL